MKKTLILGIIAPTLATGLAHGATTVFGSDNDGFGGFAANTADADNTSWTNETTGVLFTNDGAGNAGFVNTSLLKEFILDRNNGSSYTITGTVDLQSTYAADNNRIGMSIFSTSTDLAAADTGLSLQVNLGNGQMRIVNGVNGSEITSTALSGVTATELIGQTITYTTVILFTGTDIDVDFTLSSPVNSYTQTISGTVDAASFTGENFGFGTRARVRGTDTRTAPFIYEAKSFSVIPEPSSAMLTGLLGAFALLRRRR
jgi:hypothetical protein